MNMNLVIRPCASAVELKHAIGPIAYYFGRSVPSEDQAERLIRVMPAERVYAAWEGGRAVGGLGAFPFLLTVPGGRVPAAGVTVAAVLPTHRRRGALRAMMRALLDATHARGEPISFPRAVLELRACSTCAARSGRAARCSNLRTGGCRDARDVRAKFGLVASPRTGRSGVASPRHWGSAMRRPRARGASCGIRALSDESGISARDPDRLGRRGRGRRRRA